MMDSNKAQAASRQHAPQKHSLGKEDDDQRQQPTATSQKAARAAAPGSLGKVMAETALSWPCLTAGLRAWLAGDRVGMHAMVRVALAWHGGACSQPAERME